MPPRPPAHSCYQFRVVVYCPWTGSLVTSDATDPYSRAVTGNGERSIFVGDLSAPELCPPGWNEHAPPALARFADISVYELHIRDFSASDPTVPSRLRGKYLAFSPEHASPEADPPGSRLSLGLTHLKGLADAGLTHVHLLPSYDFGSVPEREEEQLTVQEDLSVHPPDSDRQQFAVAAIADQDAFNWGYDPVHYGVPEGSYSTDPDSTARVREYRTMVQGLHSLGLRVVLDVVYNHTFSSGPHARRFEDGDMCHSTCCNNTASEHTMMGRLMLDDVIHWARDYKVDGFRFDVMGHHMVSNMTQIRAALDALTVEADGVDGRSIYVYGEGWDFGEVALNQRGRNATQHNLAGTGIGSFNDRLRDGAMGGSPYQPPETQGFVTGLYTDPNGYPPSKQASREEQLSSLIHTSDWVRVALAGNLLDFEFQGADGRVAKARDLTYHSNQPLAYCAEPVENVLYCACHDNETLFDQVMMKAPPGASPDTRARMCRLALGLVLLGQGIPFVHAGDELLRSKSLDRDSYNSGDWFNRIDWSGEDNNFGVGLPPASKNSGHWPLKRALLTTAPRSKPGPQLIRGTSEFVRALLRVRYGTPLLRMPTSEHVRQQLRFHNTGPAQVPGVIIMQIFSSWQPDHGTWDPNYEQIVVVFNGRPEPFEAEYPPDCGGPLELHPELVALAHAGDAALAECASLDGSVLRVGARCAAVFVQRRGTA